MSKRGKHVCRRICTKSVRLILERYSEYLTSRGHVPGHRRSYIHVVEHFGRWLGRRQINKSHVQQFLEKGLPNCRCPGVSRHLKRNRAALHHLLGMLGLADDKQATLLQGGMGNVLRRYQAHLGKARGLAPGTVWRHLAYSRAMLDHFGTRRESQLRGWTPEMIERYVAEAGRGTPSRGRNVGWCARSFLRFLLQDGLIQRNLAAAVPTVARWRLASLPTTLRQDEVNRLLRAADLETPFGRRDYAIVLCISELGLRASDVANLEIDGIDFDAQVLRLRQRKEREAAVFPMTRRLCAALKTYIRHDRPACNSAAVFIQHRAPLGTALTSLGICHAVLRLARRAGLRDRIGGTHVLRRSLASRMLAAGATLKQIADFLGHTSIDTTTLYAKVDLKTLSRVALPWPVRKEVRS